MLPWRSDTFTECGRRTSGVTNVITSDELDDRIRRRGQQEAALTVCSTCSQNRSPARWDTNPVRVIAREAVRAGLGDREPSTRPEASQFGNELRAIAALIKSTHIAMSLTATLPRLRRPSASQTIVVARAERRVH